MQGLADGYFILPATVGDYLARAGRAEGGEDHPAVKEALEGVRERTSRLLSIQGSARWTSSIVTWASSCGITCRHGPG
jgi:succinate dehydrogenase / fumarate reductase, flavoprotein subunit